MSVVNREQRCKRRSAPCLQKHQQVRQALGGSARKLLHPRCVLWEAQRARGARTSAGFAPASGVIPGQSASSESREQWPGEVQSEWSELRGPMTVAARGTFPRCLWTLDFLDTGRGVGLAGSPTPCSPRGAPHAASHASSSSRCRLTELWPLQDGACACKGP